MKVSFRLDQEEGFPPIAVELLNASALGGDQFVIENTPFFTPNIAYRDVVRATPGEVDGQYDFEEVIQPSAYTSLSVILMDSSLDGFLMDLLRGLECIIEYGEFGVYRVLAVSVPPNADYDGLRSALQVLEDQDKLSYSELAVGQNI